MSNKVFLKYFSSDFTGINAECSAIEPQEDEVNRAVNLEWAPGNSLRGRTGCQIASTWGGFYHIFSHSYSRTTSRYKKVWQTPNPAAPYLPSITSSLQAPDGSVVNELLAMNSQLWRLGTFDLNFTVVTAGTYTIYSTVGSTGGIHIHFLRNGADFLDYTCGTGIDYEPSNANYKTIYDFAVAVDGTAELSWPMAGGYPARNIAPPFAISNMAGATAGLAASPIYGDQYRITVYAGHTFLPGDHISMWDTSARCLVGGIVNAVAATTIDYYGPQVSLINGQKLGYLSQPISTYPIDALQYISPTSFSVPYWEYVPSPVLTDSFPVFWNIDFAATGGWLDESPIRCQTAILNNNSYISGKRYYDPSNVITRLKTQNRLFKYDGQSVYSAGLGPGPSPATITGAAGGALTLLGAYKYKLRFKHIDANGNIITGTPTLSSYTLTGGNQTINLTNISSPTWLDYKFGGFIPNGTVITGGGPFTVVPLAGVRCHIQVGDYICFNNDRAGTNTLYRGYVWAVDNQGAGTQISVSGLPSPINIGALNQEICQGLTVEIFRTMAGQNTYYKVTECASYVSLMSYSDTLSDANLIAMEKLIEEEIGKEHDPPPYLTSLICAHQGGLVLSGKQDQPNTVFFSSTDGPEYFPTASNSFDVPSQVSSPISAIISDNYDRLAVFKNDSYFDVVGDLNAGTFSVNIIKEGDYGIVSPTSFVRVNNAVIGLSKFGLVGISNGQIDSQTFRTINARLIGQGYLFHLAVAQTIPHLRSFILTIPKNTYTPGMLQVEDSIQLLIDYSREGLSFQEREYTNSIEPSGSMAYYNNSFYHLSLNRVTSDVTYKNSTGIVYRSLKRFDGDSPTGNDGDSFIDNTQPISYILETQPINFGEPSVLKTPIRLRVFSVPNEYIAEGWVPWSCVVTTGIFPDTTYLGSGNPGGTTSTINFTDTKGYYKDIKLVQSKCLLYVMRFTTNVIREAPFFTGYEILFADAYKKEDLAR